MEIIIEKLEGQTARGTADINQKALLVRAYLIRGNLDSMRGQSEEAIAWYDKALKQAPRNAYAALSKERERGAADVQAWKRALELLTDESGPLSKREITTRMISLVPS